MNRVDRLMAIITHLQSRKYRSAAQLAEHFGISVRTVFRDLKAMQEIGVPIGFEAGQGYFIVGGFFLPPVSLTAEEANALALAEPLDAELLDWPPVLRPTERSLTLALSNSFGFGGTNASLIVKAVED